MNEIKVPAEQMTPAYVALCEKLGFKVVEAKPGKATKRDPKKAALSGGAAKLFDGPVLSAEAVKALLAKEQEKAKKLKPHWMCESLFESGNHDNVFATKGDAEVFCGSTCTQIQVVKKGGKWVRA